MKAKIALAAASACIAATAFCAGRYSAGGGPPTPPMTRPEPTVSMPDDDFDDGTPDSLPGQITAVGTSTDGRVITTIYAAPPAPEGTVVAEFEGAPRMSNYRVYVSLLPPIGEGEEALAEQAKKVLRKERPKNSGRVKSFPVLGRDDPRRHVGWDLQITNVKPLPRGWRATVWAYIRLEYCGDLAPSVSLRNYHQEVYRFEDGKLSLESESTMPGWDPAKPTSWGVH